MTIESIPGPVYTGSVPKETSFGPQNQEIPQVEDKAWKNRMTQFFIAPTFPLNEGFILR